MPSVYLPICPVNLASPILNGFRRFACLVVLLGASVAHAGSYEDFFKAVQMDDEATVASLLSRGFDGNTRDPKGNHALYLAAREKSLKVANVLLQWSKIDPEVRTASDESPLMIAALNGHEDLVKTLIAKGAAVNKTGWTALHYAATRGHTEIIKLLLDKYAYIDAESPNGTTPLMMAAFYGTPSAVKLLLESGADPLLKNIQGLSAIDFANRANRADAAEVIAAFVRARQPRGKW
jgi:ankyrin repeat protein